MLNQDLKNLAHLICSKGMRALVSVCFLALLARTLGPHGMGEWAMVAAAGSLVHSLFLNWMHPVTVRFGREEFARSGSLAATWASRWPLLLPGFAAAALLVLFVPVQWQGGLFHLEGSFAPYVLLALLGMWLAAETQNMLQVRGEFARLGYLAVAADLCSVLVLLTLQWVMAAPPGVQLLLPLVLGGNVLVWSGCLFWVWKRSGWRWASPGPGELRRNLVYAWPLVPGFLLGFTSDWGDQLILRHFFTSREVGLFQSGYQLMMLMLGLSAVLASLLLPRLIDKTTGSEDGARGFLAGAAPTSVALGLYLLIPAVTLLPLLFPLVMGEQYREGGEVFVVLCAAIPGSIISSFYGVFFNVQGRFFRSTVVLGGVKIALNLTLSLLLVPRVGVMGSAVSTAISYCTLQCLYFWDQHRYYRVPSGRAFALYGVAVLFSLGQALSGTDYLARAAVCAGALALLTFFIRRLGILNRDIVVNLCSGPLAGVGRLILQLGGCGSLRGSNS